MTTQELLALLRDPNQTGQSVDELKRLIEENPYFHTGHQLYIKGLQQTSEKQMSLQLEKTALSVRDRGVLYNYLNRPFRQQPPSAPDEGSGSPIRNDVSQTSSEDVAAVKENQNLVDSFLHSNPKIIPDDACSFHVDLTESLQENQDILTETLADIYITQGHKSKAIEIYEHLILKYPKKHIYFAAQIDRLKK